MFLLYFDKKASLRHINSKNYEKKKIKKIAKISRALKRPKNIKKIFLLKQKNQFLLYFDIKSIISTYKLKKL